MKKNKRKKYDWAGYLYVLPAFTVIAMFHIFPIGFAFIMSFFKTGIRDYFREFNGLVNYKTVFADEYFWQSMWHTIYYVIGTVPISIFLSLFVAILLNQKIKGLESYRVIYFIPVVTSMVGICIVWKYIYQADGILNKMLSVIGISGGDWLGSTFWAMPAIIFMSVWKGLGYNVVIFLAGLQNIPMSLYDAAKIDGANKWQQFWNVTWPMISPTTFFVLIMATISSFQVFGQIFIMTGGGPLKSTTVVIYHLYEKAYGQHKMGEASAIAFIIFTIIISFTFLQKKFVGEKVHYS
jgi:multiple sugar transport system permease protein